MATPARHRPRPEAARVAPRPPAKPAAAARPRPVIPKQVIVPARVLPPPPAGSPLAILAPELGTQPAALPPASSPVSTLIPPALQPRKVPKPKLGPRPQAAGKAPAKPKPKPWVPKALAAKAPPVAPTLPPLPPELLPGSAITLPSVDGLAPLPSLAPPKRKKPLSQAEKSARWKMLTKEQKQNILAKAREAEELRQTTHYEKKIARLQAQREAAASPGPTARPPAEPPLDPSLEPPWPQNFNLDRGLPVDPFYDPSLAPYGPGALDPDAPTAPPWAYDPGYDALLNQILPPIPMEGETGPVYYSPAGPGLLDLPDEDVLVLPDEDLDELTLEDLLPESDLEESMFLEDLSHATQGLDAFGAFASAEEDNRLSDFSATATGNVWGTLLNAATGGLQQYQQQRTAAAEAKRQAAEVQRQRAFQLQQAQLKAKASQAWVPAVVVGGLALVAVLFLARKKS